MARLGRRTYVFADVVWDPNTNESYVKMPDEPERNHLAHGAKYRAAKLPLRAFIDAPSSGSAWPKGVVAPRAVSAAWYERMCPPERRYFVDTREINSAMSLNLGSAEGLDIVAKWGKYLRTLSDKPCVELIRGSDRLIDWECVILLILSVSYVMQTDLCGPFPLMPEFGSFLGPQPAFKQTDTVSLAFITQVACAYRVQLVLHRPRRRRQERSRLMGRCVFRRC